MNSDGGIHAATSGKELKDVDSRNMLQSSHLCPRIAHQTELDR